MLVADNKKARIFTVTALTANDAEVIRGNVKNHVKVGGWSQQRYERRRDKQLLAYARSIVEALERVEAKERVQAIILVGGREILQAVHENLPQSLLPLVLEKAVDLSHGDESVNQELLELFEEQELRSERGALGSDPGRIPEGRPGGIGHGRGLVGGQSRSGGKPGGASLL